ncbi:MAG TPA: FxSxx-COOH system tetratricopeptide repeat protein, partial [Umezawaea sp.]|nr:FxSxx-COOH system tetratricopeptide repeat protein [Umezawaea sp.]
MSRTPSTPEPGVVNVVTGGVSGPVVQAQVIGGVHVHQPARSPVALPHRAGVFPPRATAFQARATTDLLVRTLEPGGSAVLTSDAGARTSVVTGLGGVGKTQVALDYAERLWESAELGLIAWVTAGSRAAIVSGYARLAADLTGVEDAEPEHAAQRLMEWLATAGARWLIVLDDVQNPRDLNGLWPPVTGAGRVVVTTRRRDAALRGHRRHLIDVGVFSPHEASAYLRAALGDHGHLLDRAVDHLSSALGFLPLALAQAGAYMVDRDLTCAAYLRRFRDRRRTLASLLPEPDGLPDEHRATVAATWSLSIEQANRLEPAGVASPLLDVASLLDANGIPADVFATDAVAEVLASATGRPVDEEAARDGLRCLNRLNLITLDPGSTYQSVRVHALVQRATRDALPADRLPVLVRAVGDALMLVWPEVEQNATLGQVLRANADALAEAGAEHLWRPDGHPVLFRGGTSRADVGLVAEARDYFHRLRVASTNHLGPDHLHTLTTRHHLAHWRGEAGDTAGAVTSFERLSTDQHRLLGPDHVHTLTTRNGLACWLARTGDPASAAAALETLLSDCLRVLGQDHPETLTARRNLAYSYGRAADPVRAVAALEALLEDSLRVLGPDSPDTLTVRNSLAFWRGRSGDPTGAMTAFERLVADRSRVLGPDHPDTLIARSNLADWRGRAGDPTGAATALETLVSDCLRVLGSDHPETLTARNALAYCYGQAGDQAGAVTVLEELLADRLRVLGPENLNTVATRRNIAYWRGRMGDPAGGAAALKALVA